MEPEDHSQKNTNFTKNEKNIEASTSTVIPHPIHPSETKKSNDEIDNKEKTQIDNENAIFETLRDTARLVMCTMLLDTNDVLYSYIKSDERALQYILNGKVLDLETKKADDQKENPYDPKEIYGIQKHIIIFGVHFYLVQWKTWSIGFCTWECVDDLCNSQHLLDDYVEDETNDQNNLIDIDGLHIMLSKRVVSKMFDLFTNEDGDLALPQVSPEDLSCLFDGINIGPEARRIEFKRSLNTHLRLIALSYFHRFQSLDNTLWNVNNKVVNIKLENNVDLGPHPYCDFVYVTENIPPENVNISNDPPIGCECTSNCKNSGKCCNKLAGYSRPYNANKRITVDPGCPVFECNNKCKCNNECKNRVVQLGSTVAITVYKTKEYGWGVKASQFIEKGQFVALYTGEIITVEESKNRLKENALYSDYMWNLDFNDQRNNEYVIDGSNLSNFTRFINHSCDSNLNVYTVWINCLPELALFASKNIADGEQLTLNYFARNAQNKIMKNTGIRCLCNKENCQGYYF